MYAAPLPSPALPLPALARLLLGALLLSLLLPALAPLRPLPLPAAAPLAAEPAAADVPAGWLRAAEARIAAEEYHLSPAYAGGYQAPNRAQGLRSFFGPEGWRVQPRTGAAGWDWGLRLLGYGAGAQAAPLEPATLSAAGARIDYRRGPLTEWYVNSERGVKHNLSIAAPPAGGADLYVEYAIDGGLRAHPEGATALIFRDAAGADVLRYDGLLTFDAAGRTLPARFALPAPGTLRIVVDTTGATYPITIDPLATSSGWTASGSQANALFGQSVASAGDVNGDGYVDVIIGAPGFDAGGSAVGRAYVYYGSAAGPAATPAATYTGAGSEGRFGLAVASAGDVNGDGYSDIIIGAPVLDNPNLNPYVRIYLGSAGGPAASPARTLSGVKQSWFGAAVASAGDVNGDGYSDIIIGASQYTLFGGAAYGYYGSAGGIGATASWQVNGPGGLNSTTNFGHSLAGAGDVNGDGYADVIVGAYEFGSGGWAGVYMGSSGGLGGSPAWTRQGAADSVFGESVAGAGDVNGDGYADVIVGDKVFGKADNDTYGRINLYYGSAVGLAPLGGANWAYSPDTPMQLGGVVAAAGDVNGDGYADLLATGETYRSPGSSDWNGAALVFFGAAGGPGAAPNWMVTGAAGTRFGGSAATAGDVNGDGYSDLLVGAFRADSGGLDASGRAFFYAGGPDLPGTSPSWARESGQGGAQLGASVAAAGDVNGDGLGDLAVGVPRYDGGQTDEGRVLVYYGTPTGPAASPSWSYESNTAGAQLGLSLAAGDVSGDGYSDLAVGAPFDDPAGLVFPEEGRVRVFYGSSGGPQSSGHWSQAGGDGGMHFGWAVATGDFNGDGIAELAVGAPDAGGGLARVYMGTLDGLTSFPIWERDGGGGASQFGYALAGVGDTDRDGFDELLVGAPGFSGGEAGEGRAEIFSGGAAGPGTQPTWSKQSNKVDARFGKSVGAAGDVNGDSFADIIIGAPGFTNGQSGEGRAFVYYGNGSGVNPDAADWTVESNSAGAAYGAGVASAGDVNGDGFADVLVSAPALNVGALGVGAVYLYLGRSIGLGTSPAWATYGGSASNISYGASVAGAGDVNGDGFSDIVVGAPNYSNGQISEGLARFYFGGGRAGRSLAFRQRNGFTGAPLAPGGTTRMLSSFQIRTTARSPFGRGTVRLEWELKPIGFPLSGTDLQLSPWVDSGSAGAAITRLVGGLSLGSGYHWRARVVYSAADTPLLRHSRWFSSVWHGGREADMRYTQYRQAIDFPVLPDRSLLDPPFSVFAIATSGLAVAFSSSTPGTCTAQSNGTVTLVGTGTCTIVAAQSGDNTYAAASRARSFAVTSVAKQNQTISFAALADKLTGDPPFQVSATASSGLSVSFSATGVCSVNGSTVTLSGQVGGCTITAAQAGNAAHNPAPAVERSFSVSAPPKQDQTITFAALPDKLTSDPPFGVSATASSGLSVSFSATGVCSVNGSTVTLSGEPGACTITADQAGDSQYEPAPSVSRSFAVSLPLKQSQTIAFAALPDRMTGDPAFSVNATASSGLPVSFSATGVCSVQGVEVTLSGTAGTCTITADQAGDSQYEPATPVGRSFAVIDPAKQDQTIAFAALPDKLTGDAAFDLSATASSGLPVSFSATGVCSVSGGVVTLSGASGVCTVTATQDGNGQFNPATPVSRSFAVSDPAKQDQTIAFAALPDKLTGDAAFDLSATASSGLPVSFSATGVCSVSGGVVTLSGVSGVCTISAAQAGNATFNPATPVSRSFMVAAGAPGYTVYLPMIRR